MADLVTPVAAFVLGAALARANSCTVASARRLVFEGRPDWLLGLAIAIGWAGLTMTAFAIALPQVVRLPAQLPLTPAIVAGGVLLGIGATINRGCFLGSVARLGRGELDYFFTLAGIALALALASRLQALPALRAPLAGGGGQMLRSGAELAGAGAVFAPLALLGAVRWLRRPRQTLLALMMVGVAGGTVYACNPGWSYTSGLFRLVSRPATGGALLAESGTLAVLAGVIASARLGHTLAVRLPAARPAAQRLAGGLLMGLGALLVPGGNDTLMLWAIPGLTLYGLVAYAIMIATITALLAAGRRLQAAAPPPRAPARPEGTAAAS